MPRPPTFEEDLETEREFELYGRLHVTYEEIARLNGISRQAVYDRMSKSDYLRRAYERGQALCKKELKHHGLQLALSGEHKFNALLIFYLKNFCGFTDKQEITGANGSPLVNKIEIVAMNENKN